MLGCQRGFIELRCPLGPLRAFGEFPQAFGHLYKNRSHSDNDGYHREINGRIARGVRPGDQANHSEAVQ